MYYHLYIYIYNYVYIINGYPTSTTSFTKLLSLRKAPRHASNPIPASGAQDLGTAGPQVLQKWMVYNGLSWIIQ